MKIILNDKTIELADVTGILLLENFGVDFEEIAINADFDDFAVVMAFHQKKYMIKLDEKNELQTAEQKAFDFFNDFSLEAIKNLFELTAYLMYNNMNEVLLWHLKFR